MSVKYEPWRKEKKWVVYVTRPLTGKKMTFAWKTEEEAISFEQSQDLIKQKEKAILKKKREKKVKCSKVTVKSLLESFLTINFTNKTTIKQNTYHAAHIIGAFGMRVAEKLTPSDMLAFVEAQKLRGLMTSTAHRRISILKSALSWGVTYGLVSFNPLAALRLPHAHPKKSAPPTPKEATELLKHAAAHVQRTILLGLYCGPRIGPSELFKLSWHDVDLENGMIRFQSADKNDKDDARDVPIHNALYPYLKSWLEDDARHDIHYVIHWKGKRIQSLNKAWHSAKRKSGINRKLRPYDLRHAFCTYSMADGADIKTIAELMGHKDPSMILKVYQHVLDSQKVKAINTLKDRLHLATLSKKLLGPRRVPILGIAA